MFAKSTLHSSASRVNMNQPANITVFLFTLTSAYPTTQTLFKRPCPHQSLLQLPSFILPTLPGPTKHASLHACAHWCHLYHCVDAYLIKMDVRCDMISNQQFSLPYIIQLSQTLYNFVLHVGYYMIYKLHDQLHTGPK